MQEMSVIPELGRFPGEGNDNPLQYSCWEIPWIEEHGGLQSMGYKRARHDLATKQQYHNQQGLTYSTGNSIQYFLITYKGKESTKEKIYI